MSSRGRSRGFSNKSNKYRNEHDDRDRTVSFNSSNSSKTRGFSYGGRNRRKTGYISKRGNGYNKAIGRSRLGEDDIDMDGNGDNENNSRSSRFSPYNRGSNSKLRGRGSYRAGASNSRGGRRFSNDQLQRIGIAAADQISHNRNLPDSEFYKIVVPHGKNTEKSILLQLIAGNLNTTFVPIQFHYEQNSAVFHVNDKSTAETLRDLTKRISLPSGYKMIFVVRTSEAPLTHINDESVEKLKICMSNRYDPTTKVLNLENLGADQDMKKEGLFFSVGRYNVMAEVLKIIKENIPELTGLKLGMNKLYNLNSLKSLADITPNLEQLDIGNNQLKSDMDLDALKNLKLTGLVLDGNPLCDKFKDNTSYISAIRKRFPKLVMLDGHNLPPPITFDIEAPTSLPSTQGSHFQNDQARDLVCRFLLEYFKVYDSDDRQGLLAAYHENAIFSLTCSYNKLVVGSQPNFNNYLSDSRNIVKVTDSHRRQKLLKSGKLSVVAALNQLPKTQHDTNSIVDVTLVSPQVMSFTVTGIFKERSGGSHPPFRHFSRMFVTTAMGSGIVIVNEELFITNATSRQIKSSFQSAAPAATAVASPSSSPAVAGPSSGPSAQTAEELLLKKQMIEKFCEGSKMNEEWSKVCLEKNNWDFDKAVQNFIEFNQKGQIPPEAFNRS